MAGADDQRVVGVPPAYLQPTRGTLARWRANTRNPNNDVPPPGNAGVVPVPHPPPAEDVAASTVPVNAVANVLGIPVTPPQNAISAKIVPVWGDITMDLEEFWVPDQSCPSENRVEGTAQIKPRAFKRQVRTLLVQVAGTSIKWFGVVVPVSEYGTPLANSIPHLFFTPFPMLGGYADGAAYDQFVPQLDQKRPNWFPLHTKYTRYIGAQILESSKPHILVIPYYQFNQSNNLGVFLTNWREVLVEVLAAALTKVYDNYSRELLDFPYIYSSCFSSGLVPLENFTTKGTNVDAKTFLSFVLDGAETTWRPNKRLEYRNVPIPAGQSNPVGPVFFVGGRLEDFLTHWAKGTPTHNICPFLLFHGLSKWG